LKYQSFKPRAPGCKDIAIRKLEFVLKNQFLCCYFGANSG